MADRLAALAPANGTHNRSWQGATTRCLCSTGYAISTCPQRNTHEEYFRRDLSFSVTEQTLRSLFETYGAVGRVNLVTDRDSGQPRGFAFVEMTNNAEAEKAIGALNGREVEGRTLNVNEARPKEDRSSRGGGFGRKRW